MQHADTSQWGTHSLSSEEAEPFAVRTLRETFLSYPPAEQARIRQDVARKLAEERRHREFRGRASALARLADKVYGIDVRELQ